MRTFFLFFICVLITIGISAQQTNKKGLPIGVFDSGTGGLTVLEAMLTLDAFNNVTGKPGADGKPDFDKEYFQYLADHQQKRLHKELLEEADLQKFFHHCSMKNMKSIVKNIVKMLGKIMECQLLIVV